MLIFDLICGARTMTHLRASRNLITRYFQITGLSRRLPTAAAATTYGRRSLHVGPWAPVGRGFKVDPCRWLGNGKIASKWSRPIVVPLAAHSKCAPSNQWSDPLPATARPSEEEAIHTDACYASVASLPKSVCLPSSGRAKTINETLRHLLFASPGVVDCPPWVL